MASDAELAGYYAARAAEYERVYERPERQRDLARLRAIVAEFARRRRVLEVACGTGYWTAVVARTARSVLATDITEEVLAVARAKSLPPERVTFRRANAYDLTAVPGDVDAALAAFWWSHVPREELPRFLHGLHGRLASGARVLLLDNRYVEGSSTPIARTDARGNTYQRRVLTDGTAYEVLKNFPTPAEVRGALESAGAGNVTVVELPYYWYASYEIARAA
ncbi:MAG TPA: class I SAM-dependent methyltransferase [Gemmatimonadaceae bacterium]|nr:class I SAM-dependent methyltransferase [Gemmatimonadaceae bacterium]